MRGLSGGHGPCTQCASPTVKLLTPALSPCRGEGGAARRSRGFERLTRTVPYCAGSYRDE